MSPRKTDSQIEGFRNKADPHSLMVLCPYIYIMMSPNVPALTLQPTEIHSAHWVSLRALQCPLLSIYKPCDISDRFTKSGGRLTRALIRAVFGQAMFPAIHLVPSESLYCSTAPHFLPSTSPNDHTKPWLPLGTKTSHNPQPLILWGLTLGNYPPFLTSNHP